MADKRCIQGRWLGGEQIQWLRGWIEERPSWSRKALAQELCRHWSWRDGRDRLKDFAARSLLLKLEAQGLVRLPALQIHKRRKRRAAGTLGGWREPALRPEELSRLSPLKVLAVPAGTPEWNRWSFYLENYHYLGWRMVGENIGYLIQDAGQQDVACLLFGAAAWKCAVRDRFFGWENSRRLEGLSRVANNTRFLILPWVRVKCLASHILGLVTRRIDGDWQGKYGHGLDWLETFVDSSRFAGVCYAAANWQCLGLTRGRGRQDRWHQRTLAPKKVFVYRVRA